MPAVKFGLEECRKKAGRRKEPWRGVNLGGFLLLEPGTAIDIIDPTKQKSVFDLPDKSSCEYDLMQIMVRDLGAEKAAEKIVEHRRRYIDYLERAGFKDMKKRNLNAVRIPIPYWIAFQPDEPTPLPTRQDPYVREQNALALYIDRAIAGARKEGLQVVLDLHAAPGGENDGPPCGREWKNWQWENWSRERSQEALEILAERYGSKSEFDNVTGIEVCNEPSEKVPSHVQYEFYQASVDKIRKHMPAERVTIILPNFKRGSMQNFINYAKGWQLFSGGGYENVVFDFHYYYCFGHWFQQRATLADQLREVMRNASLLAAIPAVVGEWSLGLGEKALSGEFVEILSKEKAQQLFKEIQIDAYSCASHGWFFWNWMDLGGDGIEWDFQKCFAPGSLSSQKILPAWDGRGQDPLEICNGDHVVLRSHHGKCVVAKNTSVQPLSWFEIDASAFKVITIGPGPDGFVGEDGLQQGSAIRDGYVVRLQLSEDIGKGDKCLAVDAEDAIVLKSFDTEKEDATTAFIIHVVQESKLRHCGIVFLQNRKTFKLIVTEPNGKRMHAKWMEDYDKWQIFSVEKRFSQSMPKSERRVDFNHTPVRVNRKRTMEDELDVNVTPQPQRTRR
eukprot:TRINITY_DN62797_c0_g1_i1.p1 TRINITY_DN62797_c0_g1~~TRINITY_DN62797_c0_g1_i1.p1  ORF type:complete len:617 (+),score=103.77 TRINITY_DN62797_c0_g1_i1:37-1887(+)